MKRHSLSLKANVSQKILNWHSLRHSHSAEICIHFYCLSWLRQARQRKMIQSSALWLCLGLCQFKISWDTEALRSYLITILKTLAKLSPHQRQLSCYLHCQGEFVFCSIFTHKYILCNTIHECIYVHTSYAQLIP